MSSSEHDGSVGYPTFRAETIELITSCFPPDETRTGSQTIRFPNDIALVIVERKVSRQRRSRHYELSAGIERNADIRPSLSYPTTGQRCVKVDVGQQFNEARALRR